MRSNNELVKELRTAPGQWMDAAIVVAFENRFEFVSEDHPDPLGRLNSLQRQGGLAIGLSGVVPAAYTHPLFFSQVFQEYKGQSILGASLYGYTPRNCPAAFFTVVRFLDWT